MDKLPKIQSEYVKNKLKGLEYNSENKIYIQNLILIELIAQRKELSTEKKEYLKNNYYVEYKEIHKELNFDEYESIIFEEIHLEEQCKRLKKIKKQKSDLELFWLSNGGIIKKNKPKISNYETLKKLYDIIDNLAKLTNNRIPVDLIVVESKKSNISEDVVYFGINELKLKGDIYEIMENVIAKLI